VNPWLDGYEHVPIEGCAGNYIDVPWRMVLHSTEGRNGSMAGLIPFFQARPCSTPHFAIDPLDGRKVQFIPLDRSAAALRGGQGGYETNRARCIQTEIIGFAAESHTWPDAWLDFIGRHVGDVARQVPLNLSRVVAFKGQGDGVLATENAAQRMSGQAWHAFDGVCGHQHVPFNDHWDPGKLNIARVLAAAGGATPEEDMPLTDAEFNRIADVVEARLAASDKVATLNGQKAHYFVSGRAKAEGVGAKFLGLDDVLAARGSGTVDVVRLAAELRTSLGDAIADELADRLKG
jgi:hypothetical protein